MASGAGFNAARSATKQAKDGFGPISICAFKESPVK
jgi:hypothetical protein